MEIFDNVTRIVRDDLTETIKPHSRISIAAACFSIYAYQELKKQLSSVDQCRFIFTSPTFVTEKTAKEKREFYIPRLNRERSLYGTEFEVKLRNELTQKAIARECAEWIRKKATFKSNSTQEGMQGFMNVDSDGQPVTYKLRPDRAGLRQRHLHRRKRKRRLCKSIPCQEAHSGLCVHGRNR